MSTKFLRKFTGSSDANGPADRSTDAGIGYKTNDGKIYYNDAGTLVALKAEGKVFTDPPVSAAAATLAATAALHAGKSVYLNRATGVTVTLPAATGSGAKYRFVNATALSGGSHVIQAANASDYFLGAEYTSTDNGSGAGLTWPTVNSGTPSTESDTLTWNGTTKGGRLGDEVSFEDIAANVWAVRSLSNETGSEATPFTAAV